MFPMTPIAVALALLICTGALAAPATPAMAPGSLVAQAQGLPAGFTEHFLRFRWRYAWSLISNCWARR